MNLCIDIGNSRTKAALFQGDEMVSNFVFRDSEQIFELFEKKYIAQQVENCILSSTAQIGDDLIEKIKARVPNFIEFSHNTAIPVTNLYKTPETLGKDRLAAVVAANFLQPYADNLVVDAGTAITFDFIDKDKNYCGGTISLGLQTRFRALHEFTGRLPLVEVAENEEVPFFGYNTQTAIAAGVLNGVIFEIDNYINVLKEKNPNISVFLTGGDAFFLANRLKNRTFAENFLVLIGLNRIINHNAEK
jgi:type III pantothenate kinase